MIKTKKKEDGPKQVCVSRAPRGKKKSVTVVTGLSSFGKDFMIPLQVRYSIIYCCKFTRLSNDWFENASNYYS